MPSSENAIDSKKNQAFTISLFDGKRDNKPKEKEISWRDFLARVKLPYIRKDKDGEAFSPCIFQNRLRKKENVSELWMLIFDVDTGIESNSLCKKLRKLNSVFVVYSTHSHKRQTEKNTTAESRWRVCIPLSSYVPASEFLRLWQGVNKALGLQADENAKDVSRLHYKPVKASADSPYDFHIEENENFFAWSEWLEQNERERKFESNEKQNGYSSEFVFHEDRHAELTRRIIANGKPNSSGNYDAKGLCHNGKGETGLAYFPESGAVKCKKDPPCSYDSILYAYGLPSGHLPSNKTLKETNDDSALRVVCLADVEAEEVSWLWHPYIPLGKLTLLDGEEGIGKSWFLCAIIGRITQGEYLPFASEVVQGNVLMLSGSEDGLADTIKPRLIKVGADCTKVYAIDEPFTFDEKGLKKLASLIAEYKPLLVIIDPLFDYIAAKTDINTDNQSRAVTKPLREIAQKFGCAIVAVRHIGKAKGNGEARAAGLGGIGFRAAGRSNLLVGCDPQDRTKRAMVLTKSNLADVNAAKAVGFTIDHDGFHWLKESNLTAERILARMEDEDTRHEQNEAIAFLREALSDGEKLAEDIKQEGTKLGLSEKRLRTARTHLKIKIRRDGFGKGSKSYWSLPSILAHENSIDAIDAHENNMGKYGKYDETRASMEDYANKREIFEI